MVTCTFHLNNRFKTITAENPKDCWNIFKKDYGEAENEIRQIDVMSPIEKVSVDLTVFKNTWINL